jgi:hypothetical protein
MKNEDLTPSDRRLQDFHPQGRMSPEPTGPVDWDLRKLAEFMHHRPIRPYPIKPSGPNYGTL